MSTNQQDSFTTDERLREGNAAFDALTERVLDSVRLEKLNDRELVFEVSHSSAADDPAVNEMMFRLWPDWTEAECPPDCWACKQEASRDEEPPEPDGEEFRGNEAAAYEAEEQARIQRELK